MRTFEKSTKLDNVCYDVRGPVVEEADRMIADGVHILKLNIGNPAPFGFTAPEEVIRDMMRNLPETEGYSDSKGLFPARKAIMQYCQLKKIPNVEIGDIYTGNGVSELITMSMQGLLNNGDEILMPSPDYPLWTAHWNRAAWKPAYSVPQYSPSHRIYHRSDTSIPPGNRRCGGIWKGRSGSRRKGPEPGKRRKYAPLRP